MSLVRPFNGRSRWTGILRGTQNEEVLLEVDGIVEAIPYEDIKKAHVIGTIDFSS